MATAFAPAEMAHPASTPRPAAIGGARFDALLIWGAPPLALLFVYVWALGARLLPHAAANAAMGLLLNLVAILTYAHLIAVAPRAYLNRAVFDRFPARLVLAPVLLVAGFAVSPPLLVAGMVLAVFWDVHHSAMQTFGLGRIYDARAGNDAAALRRTDLLLNAALYIGPIFAGGALIEHIRSFGYFAALGWHGLPQLLLVENGWSGTLRAIAILVWGTLVGFALWRYRLAERGGYRMPLAKRRLLLGTAAVSIAAWGLAPPFIAFAIVNLFHAIQYFALVWLQEGKRIGAVPLMRALPARLALPAFVVACFLFGIGYWLAMMTWKASAGAMLAPFIACSLLHFWYDGFVWSVRARQV